MQSPRSPVAFGPVAGRTGHSPARTTHLIRSSSIRSSSSVDSSERSHYAHFQGYNDHSAVLSGQARLAINVKQADMNAVDQAPKPQGNALTPRLGSSLDASNLGTPVLSSASSSQYPSYLPGASESHQLQRSSSPALSDERHSLARQGSKHSGKAMDNKLADTSSMAAMMVSLCKEVETRLDQKLVVFREQILQDVHATIRTEAHSLVEEEMSKLREQLDTVRTEAVEAAASASSFSPNLCSPEVVSESGCTGYQMSGSFESVKEELRDSVIALLKIENVIPSFSQDIEHIHQTMRDLQQKLEERSCGEIQVGGIGAKDLHSMIKDTANLSLSLAKELKRDRQQRNRDYSESVERFRALESHLKTKSRSKAQQKSTSEDCDKHVGAPRTDEESAENTNTQALRDASET